MLRVAPHPHYFSLGCRTLHLQLYSCLTVSAGMVGGDGGEWCCLMRAGDWRVGLVQGAEGCLVGNCVHQGLAGMAKSP